MKAYKAFFVLILCSTFMLSGCVVRTYQVTKDRVDQDLSSGNHGYLMGQAPVESIEAKERKLTRETHVVEIELASPIRFEKLKKRKPGKEVVVEEVIEERDYVSGSEDVSRGSAPAVNFQKYTVRKADTLQKISQKFYGTTKKWSKIYDANSSVLKGPNKIYPGQVLNIPVEGMKEPGENLK